MARVQDSGCCENVLKRKATKKSGRIWPVANMYTKNEGMRGTMKSDCCVQDCASQEEIFGGMMVKHFHLADEFILYAFSLFTGQIS